jgi:hypothetical protein
LVYTEGVVNYFKWTTTSLCLSNILELITDPDEEYIVKKFEFPKIVGTTTCILNPENEYICCRR